MRRLWPLILVLLWASTLRAGDVQDPPPPEDTKNRGQYLWALSVTHNLHVLTTTNRVPVGGARFGYPGEMILAVTSTNKGILNINIGEGLNQNWGEVRLN